MTHPSKRIKRTIAYVVSFILCISVLSCTCTTDSSSYKDIHDMSLLTTVFLVPLDNVSENQMEELKESFMRNFADSVWYPYTVEILNGMASPDSCKNDLKTRLSAKRMISFLEDQYGPTAEKKSKKEGIDHTEYYIIGVTNRDIATNAHGKADYGILGLSYTKGHRASIVSTYRLKNKKDLWKLAVHEFAHGYFGAPHCPNDDPHCILQDAKGGSPHFEKKNTFCSTCWLACDTPSNTHTSDRFGLKMWDVIKSSTTRIGKEIWEFFS